MGLAASQARFLAITARKADCEFRSMQNAQEKLSITRELAQASADYQEAMNQTKLVWDFDGSGALTYDLDYNLLMSPTELNNFTPCMVTQRTGQIVLNHKYYQAALDAGIDANGSTPRSAAGFATFVEQLGGQGIVSQSAKEAILELSNSVYKTSDDTPVINPTAEEISNDSLTLVSKGCYDRLAGYGAAPISTRDAYLSNLTGLTFRLKNLESDWTRDGSDSTKTLADVFSDIPLTSSTGAYNSYKLAINKSLKTSAPTIEDLLKKDVVFMRTGDNESERTAFEETVNEILDVMENMIKAVFVTGDATTAEAITKAGKYVRELFLGSLTSNRNDLNTYKTKIDAVIPQLINASSTINGYVYGAAKKKGVDDDTNAVSLSNMFSAYLTYIENILNGYDSGYFVAPTVQNSSFVTDNPNYTYILKDDEKLGNNFKRANFFMEIYNNLCVYGYTEDSEISTDKALFENKLKNGTYFLSSQSIDGFFYQNRYNDTDCIVEVKDQDAIARAEAEFAAMKTKLTYKEEKIDVEMKNIDLELSALTTEYDSVKQMISNNVQKIFSQFQ